MPKTRSNTENQYNLPLTVAQIDTITAADQTFDVYGTTAGGLYAVYFEAMDAGIQWGIGQAALDNKLTVRFSNPTAGNITPGVLQARIVEL